MTSDGVLFVASLDDLTATKLKVLSQRVEAKDYKDIAAMVGAGVSLAHGLAAARELCGVNFQPAESLRALVYLEGADLHRLTQAEKIALDEAAVAVRDLPGISRSSQYLGLL